ncbi:lethal(2) giant larvae protein homolog 1 isoform X1 [Dendroctonus ponderosae]|uniref:lethal(2) giant larvae protein homolog 1 isoform X1 n=1 Tax=Dendroctonus ponderosae TaxID=77166 RepID=UPI002035D79D|nr:lethal(2) giant larvae protein homolog 1 isoform X1 [Dendroctonus ponderosae]
MFKFIKGKPHQSAERHKLQKELFSYRRTLQHGFPHKPSALGWDPSLRLICIGTAVGAIKVFGRPGVEFYGQHQNPIPVTKVLFIAGTGKVVSLQDDNSLHLWEVNKSSLVEVKSQALEGKLKKISTMCLESAGKYLLLGTEGGNIYLLDLNTFTMTPDIIYQDVVMQNVPQDYKLNPGAVESILEQPDHPNNILIGYNRGLMVLWNRVDNVASKTFISSQQLECLCWKDEHHFISAHNDGSYMEWNVTMSDKPCGEPVSTYGPYACKAIPKLLARELNGEELLVFSGGLPRGNCGEKYSVSVIHGENNENHVAFDFTSKIACEKSDNESEDEQYGNKVIDFILIDSRTEDDPDNDSTEGQEGALTNGTSTTKGQPEALIVLAEEELVAIDLLSKGWKMMSLPYLVALHSSAVTCSQYVSDIPDSLWEYLKDAGRAQTSHLYSDRPWPIDGGKLLCAKGTTPKRELLLTGHEDGTVRFWDAGGVTLTPMYKFGTAQFFTGDDLDDVPPPSQDPDEETEDEWPPFRKTGIFDPYSDDPRLAVKRVVMCPLSGTLAVAGTAGQVIIAKFDTEILDGPLKVVTMNIVSDRDGFVWKGHSQLAPKTGDIHQVRGFQASTLLQLHPPAAVTCVVLHADWGLVAAGTAHGLALLDYLKAKPVIVKCTLNPNDLTGQGDAPITRRKSFKKSLRESFRRLRKGRSTRHNKEDKQPAPVPNSPPVRKPPQSNEQGEFSPLDAKPVERQIEARPAEDSMGSFVRCLYFARTFLINVQNTIPTLWAGTNNGTVYAFTITVPSASKRESDDVMCHLAKEIQLKHRAPVIGIAVLDGCNKPLPEPLEVEKGVSPLPDTTQAHRVIIASEEQFKIFTLPSLKPYCKYKLTAHEGARVRRMAFATFSCTLPEDNSKHSEVDLLCLTNMGDCVVLSIPDLKRQLNAAAIKREDINGISSLVFTKTAEALYPHSSSELQRISLSATAITQARCYLPIPNDSENPEAEGDNNTSTEEAIEAPLVNGAVDSNTLEKVDEVPENGNETPHNVTVSSSVGDITIDSVKDHLGSGDELNRRISNLQVTKTVTTIISSSSSTQGEEVSSNTIASTATTTDQESNVIEKHSQGNGPRLETKQIQVSDLLLRAPLALAEDDAESNQVGD